MDKPLIKKRKIAVASINDQRSANAIVEFLSQKEGIIEVNVDSCKGFVRIKYDLVKIKFEEIEKSIKKLGFGLSNSLKEKFKRGMAKFTEQNELDNRTAHPSSCCSDPKEAFSKCRSCDLSR